MNPYTGSSFISFFYILFRRIPLVFSGNTTIASDEIQIAVLTIIAISSSLIGGMLVFKKMSMMANSLAHTILVGIVAGYLIERAMSLDISVHVISARTLIIGSILAACLTTFGTAVVKSALRIGEDASISFVFTTLFALGVLLVTLTMRNSYIGIEAIMGNADALHKDDIFYALVPLAINLTVIILLYRPFEIFLFDEEFAIDIGIPTKVLRHTLMLQTAITSVSAFRAVGAFLFLTFLVSPTLTARFITNKIKNIFVLSPVISIATSTLAVAMSRHILSRYKTPISTSGLTTIFASIAFICASVYWCQVKCKRT